MQFGKTGKMGAGIESKTLFTFSKQLGWSGDVKRNVMGMA